MTKKMPQIELPTYKSIVENEVFGKRAEPIRHPLLGRVDVTQVTRLAKFRIPTQDEVIDFIVKNAKGMGLHSLKKGELKDDDLETVAYLKDLPGAGLGGIAGRRDDDIKHLRRHYSGIGFQEGHMYLESINGVVQNNILDDARRLSREEGVEVYDRAIIRTGDHKWNLRIRLLENGNLPDIAEIEYLLDRGVRDSNVLSTEGSKGDYQCIANHVRLLYRALNSPEMLRRVVDASTRCLDHVAAETVKEVVECYNGGRALESLGGLIKHITEEMDKEKKQSGGGFFGSGPKGNPTMN